MIRPTVSALCEVLYVGIYPSVWRIEWEETYLTVKFRSGISGG